MKITIEYDFDTDGDEQEFKYAIKGKDYKDALDDIREHLRQELKYNSESYTEKQRETLEIVRDKFFEILEDNNVNLLE